MGFIQAILKMGLHCLYDVTQAYLSVDGLAIVVRDFNVVWTLSHLKG